MDLALLLKAILLGALEAGTEFLPVSSTGHLLLVGHFLGFESAGKVFEVAIQLGAIFAVMALYISKLWNVALNLPAQTKAGQQARRFTAAVLLAFLPAMVLGFFLHGFIKNVLFNPWVVCVSLIVGGLIILWLEKHLPKPEVKSVDDLPWQKALQIGAFQCLAMVPDVSRSGATIMGALWLKVSRTAATEFSFFLAMPTMLAAVGYDLYKNRDALAGADLTLIAIGLITAFVVALFVVKRLVAFVSKHGFTPFAYWRLIVGTLGLLGLIFIG